MGELHALQIPTPMLSYIDFWILNPHSDKRNCPAGRKGVGLCTSRPRDHTVAAQVTAGQASQLQQHSCLKHHSHVSSISALVHDALVSPDQPGLCAPLPQDDSTLAHTSTLPCTQDTCVSRPHMQLADKCWI